MLRRKVFATALAGLVCVRASDAGASTATSTVLQGFAGGGTSSGVVLDPVGGLFGCTDLGGSNNSGVVYEVAAGTRAYSVQANFPLSHGINPPSISASTLTIDAAGNLCGTTRYGGNASTGSIFKIAAGTHAMTTLASFQASNSASGNYPANGGQLLLDPAGNLFGTATSDGSGGDGTVFELPAGSVYELSGTGFVVPVPEPASLAVTAAAPLLLLRRRIRNKFKGDSGPARLRADRGASSPATRGVATK